MSIVLLCALLFSQAIAHYEQAGDYYRGEESTRWLFALKNICIASLLLCGLWPFLLFLKIYTETSFHFSLLAQQTSAFWKWQPMPHSWSSTKRQLKFMNRWDIACKQHAISHSTCGMTFFSQSTIQILSFARNVLALSGRILIYILFLLSATF